MQWILIGGRLRQEASVVAGLQAIALPSPWARPNEEILIHGRFTACALPMWENVGNGLDDPSRNRVAATVAA